MNNPQATGIAKAYAGTKADEQRLREHFGVKVAIFRGYDGHDIKKIVMRRGELLGVVRGLRAFGDNRSDWVKAEDVVHAKGAAILDLDTGLRSDRNGAKMFSHALSPPRPSEEYRAMQAASVETRVKGSMHESKARKIWFNKKLKLHEKLDLMTKWTKTRAYDTFGPFTERKDVTFPGRKPKR